MSVSIIIATNGRIDSLGRLLESLCQIDSRNEISHEIIIANNAIDKTMVQRIDHLIQGYSKREGGRFRLVREETPGKAAATNKAILVSQGGILAFLDDDVAVTPGWLKALVGFFEEHPFDAMQGTILLTSEAENDSQLQRMYQRYRTISLYPLRPKVMEIDTLTGAHMAIRREIFDAVGLFDGRLGPGRSGTSDDTELAERIIRAGGRIACEPKAVVYHEVDWSRLTEEYFRFRHEQQGRSRLIYKRTSVPVIVIDLTRSLLAFCWYAFLGDERRKYRAKGRCYHYRAMLREKLSLRKDSTHSADLPHIWRGHRYRGEAE